MEDHGQNQRKRHNVFGAFVDKSLGYSSSGEDNHDPKKLKPNSETPLSTIDQVPTLPFPNILVSAFKENTTGGVKFQLFMSKSYSSSASTSPPPVYTLKVTSASSSNSSAEVEPARNVVDGGVAPVLTETRLLAEGQFMLRSRL